MVRVCIFFVLLAVLLTSPSVPILIPIGHRPHLSRRRKLRHKPGPVAACGLARAAEPVRRHTITSCDVNEPVSGRV